MATREVTIAEGHTLSVVEAPVTAGPRFTVNCTCGEVITTDSAMCANIAPRIHAFDVPGAL